LKNSKALDQLNKLRNFFWNHVICALRVQRACKIAKLLATFFPDLTSECQCIRRMMSRYQRVISIYHYFTNIIFIIIFQIHLKICRFEIVFILIYSLQCNRICHVLIDWLIISQKISRMRFYKHNRSEKIEIFFDRLMLNRFFLTKYRCS
jgi:hypothetical protein